MNTELNEKKTSPIIRKYEIGEVTYIVKAVEKEDARENAIVKIKRLLKNDTEKMNLNS